MLKTCEEVEDINDDGLNPIEEGWEAESILGAADVEGQIHFLIQWYVLKLRSQCLLSKHHI